MTSEFAMGDDRQTENLMVIFWLLLAGGVLCFFLADHWMDSLLYTRQGGTPIGYITNDTNEVEMRPRSTLSWLNVYRHLGVDSGDTVFVGPRSDVTVTLRNGMKLKLGANSLAQISFGVHDTVNVNLSTGSVHVEAPEATRSRLRLNTGNGEKVLAGAQLRHVMITKTVAQTVKIVEPTAVTKGFNKPQRTIAMVTPSSDEDLLNDFNLKMAPNGNVVSAASTPQQNLFVGPPTPPESVLKEAIKAEEKPVFKPPQLLTFSPVQVERFNSIHFTDSPSEDPQALIKWKPLPRVRTWLIEAKNTATGSINQIKTVKPELVVNGGNPGHYEYVMRGLDSVEKPVTKVSRPVRIDVRTPLEIPTAQSPIKGALVVTDQNNKNDFVMLRWHHVNAEQYQLEVADNSEFKDAQTIQVHHAGYVLKLGKPLKKVFWRVRALRNRDTSAWSAASFRMANAD